MELTIDAADLIWPSSAARQARSTVTQLRLTSQVEFDFKATDLGAVLDNQLSMDLHAGPAVHN